MKKTVLLFTLLVMSVITLSAQITREQADNIVLQHIQEEAIPHYLLYINVTMPSAGGITLTTNNEEIVDVKYACWAYYLNEHPGVFEPTQHRYLFVKEDDGNLLEIITYNDLSPANLLTQWLIVNPLEDATLSTLSVSEGELEPAFQSDIYEYSVNVANNVDEITITAIPNNPNAIVTGTGTFSLEEGENIFTVTVTAEDGVTKLEYEITINRMLGINEVIEDEDIIVCPNPTTGELRIESSKFKVQSVEFFDVYGRKVSSAEAEPHPNVQPNVQSFNPSIPQSFNLSFFPPGIYFVKIKTEQGEIVKKIVKR